MSIFINFCVYDGSARLDDLSSETRILVPTQKLHPATSTGERRRGGGGFIFLAIHPAFQGPSAALSIYRSYAPEGIVKEICLQKKAKYAASALV
ncbi:hypothetical protein FRC20_004016 [Serendipita sp. 405]|nr:hypothetical protein FRC16_004422 [Serendipita sp. 398]KAG8843263.1 hypothetical protein FRC20_004016 [Serendipita sp. 405]